MATKEERKKQKSLYYSKVDGGFWSIMFGTGQRYLAAFAVFLRATNIQIGLLTSIPLLIASLSQFFSLKLIDEFKSRKKFVIITAIVQAFSWLLILSVYYLGEFKIYYLIFFAVIYFTAGLIAQPAWNSWMGDLTNQKSRGEYFASRNRIIGILTLASIITAGIILEFFKNGGERQYLGFVAVFLIACIARLFSVIFLGMKYEPKIVPHKKKDDFTFIEFIKKARFRNYGLFVIFLTLLHFSVFMAAPYFAAYVLYDLNFTYIQFMIWISAGFLTKYLSLPAWGKLTDRYGNKKIIGMTAFFLPVLPVLWMFSTNFYYIIGINLLGGVVWAGFELSSFNFVFDTTTPEKRARCISYYNVINGFMVFFGATAGSLIIKYNAVFWSKYHLVFLISGILRLIVSAAFVSKLREVRQVANISYERIFLKATHLIITSGFNNLHLLHYPKKFKFIRKAEKT